VRFQLAPPSSERAIAFSLAAGEYTSTLLLVTAIVDSDVAYPVSLTHTVGRASPRGSRTSVPPARCATTGRARLHPAAFAASAGAAESPAPSASALATE
jgi:hypothetical protein